MDNKEIRRETREKIKEKASKIYGYTAIYYVLLIVAFAIVSNIRILALIVSFLSPFFLIGFMKELIFLYRDEEEAPLNFLRYTFEDFGKKFVCMLRVALKCIWGIILMWIGAWMLFYQMIMAFGSILSSGIKISGFSAIIGIILMIVGMIIIIKIAVMKYGTVRYTLLHTEDEALTATEVVERAGRDMGVYGRQWFNNLFYWSFLMGIESGILSTVLSWIGLAGNELVLTAITLLIVIWNTPGMILSMEELYTRMIPQKVVSPRVGDPTVIIQ